MSHWPEVPLGEVLSHRKKFIQIDDLDFYSRCRVQLHAQGIVLRDRVLGSDIKTKKQQVCRCGEFLVAEIDAKLGGYGIVPPELEGAIVSSHYFLFGIDETRLDRRFLGNFIRTPAFHEQVAAQGSTNYAAIRPSHVLQYRMPLPPLTEQQRLVERIDSLARKISEAHNLKKSNLFETKRLWKVGSSLARNTNHPVQTLDTMVEFLDSRRIPLSESERSGRKGPYPYYGASGIIDSVDGFLFDEELLLLSEDGANLINRSTPIAFIAKGKYWVNNHAHVIRANNQIVDIRFLEYCLSDFDVSMFNFASAQAKLNQANARRIAFPLPPLEEQIRLVRRIDSL